MKLFARKLTSFICVITFTVSMGLFSFNAICGTPTDNSKTNKDNTLSAQSTAVIQGKVIDRLTGEKLAGVLVEIKEKNLKAYTDLDGNFKFEGLTPGSYMIHTSYISYFQNAIDNININAGDQKYVDINLSLE